MHSQKMQVLLADDDIDDCLLFKEALNELPVSSHLATVKNGEQLLQLLAKETGDLPDVLFPDLNMPRKNGVECLEAIKLIERLKMLPVVIFSTSFEAAIIDLLYKKGAQYYIRKPDNFKELKKIIHHALTLLQQKKDLQPSRENFVLTVD